MPFVVLSASIVTTVRTSVGLDVDLSGVLRSNYDWSIDGCCKGDKEEGIPEIFSVVSSVVRLRASVATEISPLSSLILSMDTTEAAHEGAGVVPGPASSCNSLKNYEW